MTEHASSRIAVLGILWGALLAAAPARAGENPQLVSVNAGGAAAGGSFAPAISGTGRHVAFVSIAPDLVPGVGNGLQQVYVRDLVTQETEVVSVSTSGELASSNASSPALTPDGRYVAFNSLATNLDGAPGWRVRDRQTGALVSLEIQGGPLALSDDGQLAVIRANVFGSIGAVAIKHIDTGVLEKVSLSTGGVAANTPCHLSTHHPMSGDGRYVVFTTNSTNLTPPPSPLSDQVYVRDRIAGTTTLVSAPAGGGYANGGCSEASISADGRYVAFHSHATNLVPLPSTLKGQVFVRDLHTGAIEIASVSNAGDINDDTSPVANNVAEIGISADGRFVAFSMVSVNLVPGLPALPIWVTLVRDRLAGLTWAACPDASGQPQDAVSVVLSRDGRGVAFRTGFSFSPADPPLQPLAYDVYAFDRFPWAEIEPPLGGAAGEPRLLVQGETAAGAPLLLAVTHALPGATALLVIGLSQANVPFKGGVLVPAPAILAPLPVDAHGLFVLNAPWPAGVPAGTEFVLQAWFADPAGPQGFSATNGVVNMSG